ncbi:MAG: DNA double-strand break repair nuclease NurA [Aquificae bacterium]|nr:DNA double-strand break repair nuclease NurA [Aquificota bacterium]
MHSISSIFNSYKDTLDRTYKEQQELWKRAKENIKSFYSSFLKDLVLNYGKKIANSHQSSSIKRDIEEIFGTDTIKFVAIDGSSFKEEFSEFLVFYGGAYAVRGTLKLRGNPVKVEYEKWDIKHDKSIIAYVPIPYVELNLDSEQSMFFATDKEKTENLSIHNQLMQLAEIYLAYTFVRSPDTDVNLILMDNSLSSIYLSNDVLHKLWENGSLKIVGYRFGKGEITPADIYISYAMPINDKLDIPSCKNFHGEFYIIRKLFDKSEFNNECSFIRENKHINKLKELGIISDSSSTKKILINPKFATTTKDSWDFVKSVFEHICEEIFVKRNLNALKIERKGKSEWLTSNDIKYLISVGLRMLIEKCWERNVILIGIAKDSATKYFSRNYLGVMHYKKIYDFSPMNISVSDRLILETIPFIDQEISAPWSTIEFDSVFMSLHLERNDRDEIFVGGFRGDIITPQERLFLRSLAQFYINRSKSEPMTGNVIFVDRIAHPTFDANNNLLAKEGVEIDTVRGDRVNPLFYKNRKDHNKVQQAIIFILDALTKNLFPYVIGYPDPLHKADWGARSMNKKVQKLIKSGEFKFVANPLKKSLRSKKEEGYGRL